MMFDGADEASQYYPDLRSDLSLSIEFWQLSLRYHFAGKLLVALQKKQPKCSQTK